MNIGFLVLNEEGFLASFGALAKKLERFKVTTKAFYKREWWNFDFQEITAFRPDLLFVWNGNFNWQYAAIRHLSVKYKMAYMENAWLPQSGNVYIDFMGVGSKSQTCLENLAFYKTPGKEIIYPEPNPVPYKDYILVPMQLPQDTSILYDSPIFKTMETFANFVKQSFPSENIIVKPHPKDPDIKKIKGVEYADPLRPIIDYIASARAVVGINSTSLIESLYWNKPVAAFGYNVAFNKGVFLEFPKNPRDILSFKPDQEKINKCLAYLSNKQFKIHEPPRAIINQIIERAKA